MKETNELRLLQGDVFLYVNLLLYLLIVQKILHFEFNS